MSDDFILRWFPFAFPFLFVGTWLLATTMLGFMSGWFNLQQWYPDDGSEEPLLKFGGQSGSMGMGVALNGCLILRAYPSGLGVGIWRIFAPFQKPLRIPWSEIEAEPSRSFFQPMVKLHLGKPSNGTLKIGARSWSRLVEAVPQADRGTSIQMPSAVSASSQSLALGILLQWVVVTTIAAAFFYFVSRFGDQRSALPLAVCIGLPAIGFGIGQLIRYARQG